MNNDQKSALILSTLAMIVCFSVWSVFSPMAGKMQEIYHLSTAEKSTLLAAPVLLGSLMRIPMGMVTDRLGARKVYVWSMLLLMLPMIAASFADSYRMLLICALFIGMAGTTFTISIAYVSRCYPPEKQGFVLGIAGLGNLGVALSNFLIPIVDTKWGTTWVFWGLTAILGMMAVVFWIGARELPSPKELKTLKQTFQVLGRKEIWRLNLYYFLTFGGFVTFSVYLPVLLKELFRLDSTDAGMQTAIFVLLATLIRPGGGYLADRIGARNVLMLVFGGISLFAAFLSFSYQHFFFFTVSWLAISLFLGIGNGAVFKLVPEVSPANTGAVAGIVGAAGGMGGFFPPIVLGLVKDGMGDYQIGFMFLVIVALICLIVNRKGLSRGKLQREQNIA